MRKLLTILASLAVGVPVLAGEYGTKAVTTSMLVSGSVTTSKLADGSVTTSKLSAGAVTTSKIAVEALDPLRIDRVNNRVGVGITNPAVDFQVGPVGATARTIAIGGGNRWNLTGQVAGTLDISNADASITPVSLPSTGGDILFTAPDDIILNGSSGGNVGIGTTNPAFKLHMSSGVFLADGTGANIRVADGSADSNPHLKINNDVASWDVQVVGARSDSFEINNSGLSGEEFSITTNGGLKPYSRTIAELVAITPTVGETYYCSDCTLAGGRVVFSTGTSAGNFADADGSDWE